MYLKVWHLQLSPLHSYGLGVLSKHCAAEAASGLQACITLGPAWLLCFFSQTNCMEINLQLPLVMLCLLHDLDGPAFGSKDDHNLEWASRYYKTVQTICASIPFFYGCPLEWHKTVDVSYVNPLKLWLYASVLNHQKFPVPLDFECWTTQIFASLDINIDFNSRIPASFFRCKELFKYL